MQCPECFSSFVTYCDLADRFENATLYCEDCGHTFKVSELDDDDDDDDNGNDYHDIDPDFDPATGLLSNHYIFQE